MDRAAPRLPAARAPRDTRPPEEAATFRATERFLRCSCFSASRRVMPVVETVEAFATRLALWRSAAIPPTLPPRCDPTV